MTTLEDMWDQEREKRNGGTFSATGERIFQRGRYFFRERPKIKAENCKRGASSGFIGIGCRLPFLGCDGRISDFRARPQRGRNRAEICRFLVRPQRRRIRGFCRPNAPVFSIFAPVGKMLTLQFAEKR